MGRMKERLKGMPEVQGRWARLAKEGAGRDYRSVGEKEAGGWGAATNHRTSVAMAVRWGDHNTSRRNSSGNRIMCYFYYFPTYFPL